MSKNLFGDISGPDLLIGDTKIKDSEFKAEAKKYFELAKTVDHVYESFYSDLENLAELLEGKFANNMKAFNKYLDFYMDGVWLEINKELKRNMQGFIEDIDSADGTMY